MAEESLQYKRTHKAIIEAFITLSERVSFSQMSVQQILDEAPVSRYTFYHHFADKYAVAEEIQAELFANFTEFMEEKVPAIESMPLPSKEHHATMDQMILQYVKANARKMYAIADIHTDTIDFWKKCSAYITTSYISAYPHHENVELEAHIYSGIIRGLEEYNFAHPDAFKTLSEDVLLATIRAASHSVGLHDEKKIDQLYHMVEKMIYPS